MRIVARIERTAVDRYVFDGKMYDSFLTARRRLTQLMQERRTERRLRVSQRSNRPPQRNAILAAAGAEETNYPLPLQLIQR